MCHVFVVCLLPLVVHIPQTHATCLYVSCVCGMCTTSGSTHPQTCVNVLWHSSVCVLPLVVHIPQTHTTCLHVSCVCGVCTTSFWHYVYYRLLMSICIAVYKAVVLFCHLRCFRLFFLLCLLLGWRLVVMCAGFVCWYTPYPPLLLVLQPLDHFVPLWHSSFKETKCFLPAHSCGEPSWSRSSKLGLRPPGLEFRILCLKGSVISFISPCSGGSTDLV